MTDLSKERALMINNLFIRFDAVFPAAIHTLKDNGTLGSAKYEWMLALIENGVTSAEQLEQGIKMARNSGDTFLPPMAKFIKWCKPSHEDIGAPCVDQAYNEACQKSHPCYGEEKNWSHEAVRYAAYKAGSHFLRTEPISKSKPVFEKYYAQACEDFSCGRIMAQIETRIPTLKERQECGHFVKYGYEIPEKLKWVAEYFQGK